MKNLLICGKNSYIGNSLSNYLSNFKDLYNINFLDLKNINLNNLELKNIDIVFYVAAIVHNPKATKEMYYSVNRDLTIEFAKICKRYGIKQFVFMSTLGVFGIDKGFITQSSTYSPHNYYEKSKYEADKFLLTLQSDAFKVAILRPPIVYGKNCKGNFLRLESFAKKALFFPSVSNEREMVYIKNLVFFIKKIMDNSCNGIFYPTDPNPVCIKEMIKKISEFNNNKILFIKIFNPFVKLLMTNHNIFAKIFGNNILQKDMKTEWLAPFTTNEALKDIYKN